MSAIERPITAGSGSLKPAVFGLVGLGHTRILSVGSRHRLHQAPAAGADSDRCVISGSGGQPRGAGRPGSSWLPRRIRRVRRCVAACCRWTARAWLLAGCSSVPSSINPVSWWHDLQGGKIAEQRPPPPGADQPYPNLATVPPKPAAAGPRGAGQHRQRAGRRPHQRAAPGRGGADGRPVLAQPRRRRCSARAPAPPPPPPRPVPRASASMPAAEAPPAPATPPAPPPAPAPATGQGAGRRGAERAAGAARVPPRAAGRRGRRRRRHCRRRRRRRPNLPGIAAAAPRRHRRPPAGAAGAAGSGRGQPAPPAAATAADAPPRHAADACRRHRRRRHRRPRRGQRRQRDIRRPARPSCRRRPPTSLKQLAARRGERHHRRHRLRRCHVERPGRAVGRAHARPVARPGDGGGPDRRRRAGFRRAGRCRSDRSRRHARVWYNSTANPERPRMSSDPSGEFHRIRRLPPYVFAEVNTAKAKARGAGEDIIDLGMGNPDSPTPPHIVAKLVEAVQDPRTHRYSVSKGIPGLRRALAAYYRAPLRRRAGPGNRGDRHARLEGGAGQPGLGDHQPGRHHPGAEPVLSDPPVRLHHRRRRGASASRPRRTRRCCARWTARCGTRCRSRPR